MSILHASPLPGQSLGGIPSPMPDFGEPNLSPTGIPDELAPAYRDSRANSYAAAHAEADADELESLRNELDQHDMTLAQFAAVMRDQCPAARVILHQHNSVHVMPAEEPGRETETKLLCWVWHPDGSAKRTHEGCMTLRELARLITAEYRMRVGGALLAVPVVETAGA